MHVCIIGIGLIGGSLVKALNRRDDPVYISAVDPNRESLNIALNEGAVQEVAERIGYIASRPDLVVIAVPVSRIRLVLRELSDWLKEGSTVTDVGSTKASVIRDLKEVFGSTPERFVPGHPIAGRECAGYASARADLFQGRRTILTPLPVTDQEAIQQVTALWKSVGSEVELMDVDHHDQVLASTSHLPHVLAFALVNYLSGKSEKDEIFRYAAGGFADFTRIASSDPQLWRDICLANGSALASELDHYIDELQVLRQGLQASDGTLLENHFSNAKQARDAFCDNITKTQGGRHFKD